MIKPGEIAIVGAAESTRIGTVPDMAQIMLHADAALNAMADAGLKPSDIDGVACAGISPVELAHYLGITPTYADGTKATVDQMSKDVTAFLVWTAEPKLIKRIQVGYAVFFFLLIFTVLTYLSYRNIWADKKH